MTIFACFLPFAVLGISQGYLAQKMAPQRPQANASGTPVYIITSPLALVHLRLPIVMFALLILWTPFCFFNFWILISYQLWKQITQPIITVCLKPGGPWLGPGCCCRRDENLMTQMEGASRRHWATWIPSLTTSKGVSCKLIWNTNTSFLENILCYYGLIL